MDLGILIYATKLTTDALKIIVYSNICADLTLLHQTRNRKKAFNFTVRKLPIMY